MQENNPVKFGQCCDKCGRPRMSCVCVQKIKIGVIGSGIDTKQLAKEILSKKYSREEVIELIEKAFSDMGSGLGIELTTYPDGTVESVDISEWVKNNLPI